MEEYLFWENQDCDAHDGNTVHIVDKQRRIDRI